MYTRFNVPTVGVHHARPRIEGARARVRRENQPAISLRALFFPPLPLTNQVFAHRFTVALTDTQSFRLIFVSKEIKWNGTIRV